MASDANAHTLDGCVCALDGVNNVTDEAMNERMENAILGSVCSFILLYGTMGGPGLGLHNRSSKVL